MVQILEKYNSEDIRKKYSKEEIERAVDIILSYEVLISYEEGVVHKGEYLLHILDKKGLKLVEKEIDEK